jgi:hypothetical protein
MYSGNLPFSAHTANVTVTSSFSMPDTSFKTHFALTLATEHFEGILKYNAISATFHIWLNV